LGFGRKQQENTAVLTPWLAVVRTLSTPPMLAGRGLNLSELIEIIETRRVRSPTDA
jgi:hypothetical protein